MIQCKEKIHKLFCLENKVLHIDELATKAKSPVEHIFYNHE